MNIHEGKGLEPDHDKTNKVTCVPSEDSNQSEHQPVRL